VPEVSYAVILTRDVERAATALRSIAAQTPPAELLLVLNEPDAEMRSFARERARDGARILHDGADLGVVLGWNLALRAAQSPHVCTVHEDSELEAGCAARLLETLREHPEAGSACPRTLHTDGSAWEGAIIWNDAATTGIAVGAADVHPVDYAGSSCLMLRRDVALGVGGFDERFFPAIYVDATMGVALWQAGHSVLCDRRAVNSHRTGAMVDLARGPRRSARFRSFLLARNRDRFRAEFARWLPAQAYRSNEFDARHPEATELDDAFARARARAAALPAVPPPAPRDQLVLPDHLEAHAAGLRRELEDEFLAHLIEREATLADEAAGLHRKYAELHAELDRVHREFATVWADRERLLEATLTKDAHA
jgi:GT2 family glycosyltransferase